MKPIQFYSDLDPAVFAEEHILPFLEENAVLREEIRVAREAAEITANLVVRQFEETERILRRFQAANAQRKAVLESATQMAIIATDEQGIVTVFNKGATNLLGYRADEIIGKKTPEIFHDPAELGLRAQQLTEETGHELSGVRVFFEYALSGRTEQEEWTFVRKDGTRFPVSMSVNALHDPEGFLCIASDITESIEKDAQLFQASKMTTLGEMSAGIAHELNKPLSAIKIANDFLTMVAGQGNVPAEHILKVAEEVSAQVDRASQIINRLREFGRKPEVVTERISINTPIRRVLAIVGQQFDLQNIEIRTDLDDTLPLILASNNRIEQVIFNMLTNARDAILKKHTCGDGENNITIRSFRENDKAVFTVTDTGTGIDKNKLDKIFEPFYTTKEVGQGMGLGLSIVYGIVRDYGGKIDVESEMGVGTTFKYAFPALAE